VWGYVVEEAAPAAVVEIDATKAVPVEEAVAEDEVGEDEVGVDDAELVALTAEHVEYIPEARVQQHEGGAIDRGKTGSPDPMDSRATCL
jgi:hypothetical protein